MKLKKIISGGQEGADITALKVAKYDLKLETGGTCPKGCRTEKGQNPALKTEFGLKESIDYTYPPRTRNNVRDSQVTIWIGNENTPGFACTKKAAFDYGRKFVINPIASELKALANEYEVINVAGNRESTNPNVNTMTRDLLLTLKEN